jgi:rhodanese-related sulfurtransferase
VIPEVDVRTAHTALAAGEPMIDVREQWEWDEVHIPGAVLIPKGQVAGRLAEIPEGRVMVQCRTGKRSADIVEWLQAHGRPDAVNVAGGIVAWMDEDLPVE